MSGNKKDFTNIRIQDMIDTDGIENVEILRKAKETTPARIGIGHIGARYKTTPMLRFVADQAAASDAVFTEVSKEVIKRLGVIEIKTKCKNKNDMITRPDWGRIIEEDQQQILRDKCIPNPQVQIYFGDGLSSPSIEANIPDLFPTIKKGLEHEGVSIGTPFFVRYCRVNTARTIAPLLGAEVACVLIGERPGLITAESMSAYIAYKPHIDMQESEYTVVSNISRYGMPPVEAGEHIVDLILEILAKKKSGVNLKG
ncbi:ethanolamine ammonia-lyase subunit EutC [Anaeromicropila herbilytica]|uniref:Ethanolamine ammonia-lyase light chain n=1 Tax=Anaeromicropila herbilytica TaxID=2785025 RepID=A0A7R7IC08_9FIRM|nr:ethanolamine ammonia-lyase subunit EutC [Anaeromicropila herbilytica]BCN29361.1 ethanolamine ammonia-lyase light chain [Anaeromicropila herbilytica]